MSNKKATKRAKRVAAAKARDAAPHPPCMACADDAYSALVAATTHAKDAMDEKQAAYERLSALLAADGHRLVHEMSDAALSIACEECGADVGEVCVNKRSGLPNKVWPHTNRAVLAFPCDPSTLGRRRWNMTEWMRRVDAFVAEGDLT